LSADTPSQTENHKAAGSFHLCQNGPTDVRALTGLSGTNVRQLVQQGETGNLFSLAEQRHARLLTNTTNYPIDNQEIVAWPSSRESTDKATDQIDLGTTGLDRPLDRLTGVQWRLIVFADVSRFMAELMLHAGFSYRPHFVTTHIEPLLAGGLLRLTVPDKLTSSAQSYVFSTTDRQLRLPHKREPLNQ
jgi:ATP-dependent DNA helicase RecG